MSLATCNQEGIVSQRSVVLRGVERDQALIFYTDQRSNKLRDIDKNDQVSLLLYDANDQVQISCKGVAQVKNVEPSNLSNFHLRSIKDYTTVLAPGTSIDDPKDAHHDSSKVYFAEVRVVLSELGYLKLDKELHVRATFKKVNSDWIGEYLVP